MYAIRAHFHPEDFWIYQRVYRTNANLQPTGLVSPYKQRNQHVKSLSIYMCSRYLYFDLGLNLNNCNLFYLDFVRKHHVHIGIFPFKQELYLKYELFLESAIKIRYRCISADGKTVKNNIPTYIQTKRKVKERTIH